MAKECLPRHAAQLHQSSEECCARLRGLREFRRRAACRVVSVLHDKKDSTVRDRYGNRKPQRPRSCHPRAAVNALGNRKGFQSGCQVQSPAKNHMATAVAIAGSVMVCVMPSSSADLFTIRNHATATSSVTMHRNVLPIVRSPSAQSQ